MAVYQDPIKKTWYANISFHQSGTKKHTTKRGFPTKRDALKYEIDFRNNLDKPITSISYKFAVQEFLKDKKGNRKVSTFDELDRIYSTYLSSLDNKPISSIRVLDYQLIKNHVGNQDLSVSYKNKIVSIMKAISKFISTTYQISDFAVTISRFSDYSMHVEMETWTPNEFEEFSRHVDRETYKDLFHILYYTGARLGEIRALYKTDFKDKNIHITKSIRNESDGVTTPKNKYSVRFVQLDSITSEIAQKHASIKGKFLLGNDHPLSQSNIDRIFRKYILLTQKDNAQFRRIRVHDLRHSHATFLINSGANIVAVSKRLGHSSVQITLKTYTHLFKENETLLIDIINKSSKD
jgi:integrase